MSSEYPACSGDPTSCPENEGYGCCQPNPPVETVPWPVVTRYSGGASHEGIGGRVWIRLSDDGPEVEYVPASEPSGNSGQLPAPAADGLPEPVAKLHSDGYWTAGKTFKEPLNFASMAVFNADQMRASIAAERAKADALRTVMVAAAEEIAAHWDAHCDAEGYGPQNLIRRLEEGIPSEYGYSAGRFAELQAELSTLREQLAEAVRALRLARDAFLRYEALHRAKNTADSIAKAEANKELASRMGAALAAKGDGA